MILHWVMLHNNAMVYHIVDIVHIDENMTQLIDFHSLESTFSDGMHQQGF